MWDGMGPRRFPREVEQSVSRTSRLSRHRGPAGLGLGAWLLVLALVLTGVMLIARGLRGADDGGADRATETTSSSPVKSLTQPPGGMPPPVQPGSGVYTSELPTDTELGDRKALCPDCDVVLVTLCSLRKDHVGAYGLLDVNTPHLDRVASQGMRFDRAYAASNFTLASLTAVLTGRFGSRTGVTGWDKGLTKDVPTLPQILGHYGYRTGGFTTDAPSGFRPDYGLDRGFQHMEITPPPPGTPDGRQMAGKRVAGAPALPARAWLSEQPKDAPVFLMLHSRTAHFPFVIDTSGAAADETGITQLLYEAGRAVQPADVAMPGMSGGTQQEGVVEIQGPDPLQVQVDKMGASAVSMWRLRYRQAVDRMDPDMGVLWEALAERDRLDRTIIIVVADHGESLNDHEELLHGDAFYDGVINVPLLIRVPGLSPGHQDALVSQVDILPTVLDLVGAIQPAGIDGVSLVPLLAGEASAVRGATLSEGGVARQTGTTLPGAVIAPPWQLLRQGRGCGPGSAPPAASGMPVCLFHMDNDPGQETSVAAANPDVVEALLSRWSGFRDSAQSTSQQLDLSPAFIQELQKSGYDFRPASP